MTAPGLCEKTENYLRHFFEAKLNQVASRNVFLRSVRKKHTLT